MTTIHRNMTKPDAWTWSQIFEITMSSNAFDMVSKIILSWPVDVICHFYTWTRTDQDHDQSWNYSAVKNGNFPTNRCRLSYHYRYLCVLQEVIELWLYYYNFMEGVLSLALAQRLKVLWTLCYIALYCTGLLCIILNYPIMHCIVLLCSQLYFLVIFALYCWTLLPAHEAGWDFPCFYFVRPCVSYIFFSIILFNLQFLFPFSYYSPPLFLNKIYYVMVSIFTT